MGYGHSYVCKSCGKRDNIFLGVGMGYPEVCERAKTAAKEGLLGKRLMKAVLEHPEGYMDCEEIIYACDCGGWRVAPKKNYFIADKKDNPYDSCEEAGGTAIYETRHMCPRCRKKMHPYPEKKIKKLTCPKCGGKLELLERIIMWD